MRKLYFLLCVTIFGISSVNAQIITFVSPLFKSRLLNTSTTNLGAKNLNGEYFAVDANGDDEIDMSEASQVSAIYFTQFYSVSGFPELVYFPNLKLLSSTNNILIQAFDDASLAPQLETLILNNCSNLATVDVSGLSALKTLECKTNSHLTTLNIAGTYALESVNCNNSILTGALDFSNRANLVELSFRENHLTGLNLDGCTLLTKLDCYKNSIASINLLQSTNLKYVSMAYNPLTSLDLSGLSLMEKLFLDACPQIMSINFAGCSSINECFLGLWNIPALDLSPLVNVQKLSLENDVLTNVDFSNNTHVNNLFLSLTTVTGIDLSPMPEIYNLKFIVCSFPTVDLSVLPLLGWFKTSGYNLNSLDFSLNHNLEHVDITGANSLDVVILKNGASEYLKSDGVISGLHYICRDDNDLPADEALEAKFPNAVINSYCSFVPGGDFYNVTGNVKMDAANDGCDNTDNLYPSLRFHITDGTVATDLIADELGNYTWPLQEGSYTITPITENTYVTATPAQFTVNFPADGESFMQNICVVPDGIHNDLEVVMVPTNVARPGFNTDYQIIFRNTGSTTQSANIDLAFDDAVMDFVTSVPMPSSQSTASLGWVNIDIAPFETKHVVLRMNLNTPLETPPLNSGSILHFTASVTSQQTDETPANNSHGLVQTVVNSFDPNDKTCLEGDAISPSMVGDYVHYLIRFENTGTFPAENIVVKDMIDTARFDMNSLVPISSNYEFVTRITDTNRVEFLFENINLPFDDANNDGYILFKIKTKPNLNLGSTISNTASIYFDYNFPIVTNTAVTTVAIPLSTDENENAFGFALYPNPVKDVLNIASKVNVAIDSVIIYNTMGQEVMKVIPAVGDYGINVSRLPVGSYVLKVFSDNKSWSSQFLKQN